MSVVSILRQLLNEAKIDSSLANKPNLSDEDKERIKELNERLTNKTKYVDYLIKNFRENDVVELINEFEKKFKHLEKKDINQYSIQDLRSALKLASDVKTRGEERREAKSGAEKIFENSKAVVFKINDRQSSCYYGAGTKWCISAKQQNMFDWYNKYNNMYFIIPKNGKKDAQGRSEKYAVQASGKEIVFWNPQDKIVEGSEVIGKYDLDMNLFPITNIVDKLKSRMVLNDDGTYSLNEDEDIHITDEFIENGKLKIRFKHVDADFYIYSKNIVSLEGSPESVGGSFIADGLGLTSLKGSPRHVTESFYCGQNELTSLEGAPESAGDFYCHNNKLTSLLGSPKQVDGEFNCKNNELTSLEGAPERVKEFNCQNNKLTSLEGAPDAETFFFCRYNELTSLEGAPERVSGTFDCSRNNLTSLEGAPKQAGLFICSFNSKKFTKKEVREFCRIPYSKISV